MNVNYICVHVTNTYIVNTKSNAKNNLWVTCMNWWCGACMHRIQKQCDLWLACMTCSCAIVACPGKNPIKIISYRVPMIFLHTKGWLKLLQVIQRSFFVQSSPISIVTSRWWMKWYILGILYVHFVLRKLGKSLGGSNFQ